uniref:non-specific serine/threonine protein kinase n=1 Tax=Bionectria ochroleuca TaxID=29856 RepID=A0A8H7NJL2_BIOOC
MAKGAPIADVLFNDELRHFSSNIAKDCDEAFGSSLIEDESMAGSMTDGDRKQRESPFSFSLVSTPDTIQGTGASAKPWDLRPLPPLPPNNSAQGDILDGDTDDAVSPTSGGGEQPTHSVFVMPTHSVERRVVSAPAQTHITRKPVTMPSINENKALNSTSGDKTRIVSAPPHNPRGRHAELRDDMEYLSKVENSIRVVSSPSESPVKIPKPLNVRKKSTTEVLVPQTEEDASQTQANTSQDAQNGAKKRKMWFRRTSRAESDSGGTVSSRSHDQTTHAGSEPANEGDTNPNHIANNKKKSFTFPFWKSNKMAGSTMSIDEEPSASAKEGRSSNVITVQPSKDKRDSTASSQRNIEVKQNWLARLFRVKPATRYLCMAISRRRARQEVAILLREWRKYGIRGIQVDKQRNIVFARVEPKIIWTLKKWSSLPR